MTDSPELVKYWNRVEATSAGEARNGHGTQDVVERMEIYPLKPASRQTTGRRNLRAGLLLAGIAVLLMLAGCNEPAPADPRMIDLAVRATMHAMPTPTPLVIEVTRVVEVRVEVEVTRIVETTPIPTATPTPSATATPLPTATAEPAAAADIAMVDVPVAESLAVAPQISAPSGCSGASNRQYVSIPVVGAPANHPDYLHGDLNLALRGYNPVEAALDLTQINGPTGADPPQLYNLFGDARTPQFSSAYRAHDWNWQCGDHGCRGGELERTSLVGMATTPGEPIYPPSRAAEIYGGGYRALVLYADEERVTLGYTREDSVATGYAVHVEGLCVDANLLASYRRSNDAGRGTLPALRASDAIGAAAGNEIAVAVRDRGAFLDPRSRKDWWRGR